MEEKKDNITIKDVARLSGLSKGTVDRVIHNRGEVSKKSYDKVMQVIKDLGYEPNIYASLLASHKERVIAVLIPQFKQGEYWALADDGVLRGATYAKTFNISVETVTYDQYNIESFRQACNKIIEMDPAGVVLAPMFKNETAVFANELREKQIPYAFIDTKLEQDGYFAYFGTPMYQSGYLCADLLTDYCPPDMKVAIVRIERDKNRQSDPTVTRRAGFMDYMTEHFPDCEVLNVFINPHEPESIKKTLTAFFKANPGVTHIVMFNSRVHLIVDYLESRGPKERKLHVIGFDNLAANLAAVRKGTVKFLITQHSDEQTSHAIHTLVDYFVLKKMPARKDNYMHMDILTKHNADYY